MAPQKIKKRISKKEKADNKPYHASWPRKPIPRCGEYQPPKVIGNNFFKFSVYSIESIIHFVVKFLFLFYMRMENTLLMAE